MQLADSTTASERSKLEFAVWATLLATAAVTAWLYWDVFVWLVQTWSGSSDYSHGFFVPVFVAYLLWNTRSRLAEPYAGDDSQGYVLGVACMAAAVILRLTGMYLHVKTFEGLSLIAYFIGLAGILGGQVAIRWILVPVLFLVFMIPLPGFVAGSLSEALQTVATASSTFALQMFGIPAVANGNIITLSNGQVGVAEACSGLRMLYSFFALTVGACMLIDRTWLEKGLITISAIPIAIAANCIRIIATGLAYEFADTATAKHIFHDVAGWLMMPIGFAFLMVLLSLLDRVIITDQDYGAFR